MMTPAVGKLNFTAHVTLSVAWLGSVLSFLVLSIAGVTSTDPDVVRGAYLAMNLIGAFVIVPLSLAALVSGLVQSLGTNWGLFRHYWVVTKLTLTLGATALLLLHQFTAVSEAAKRASVMAPGSLPDVEQLGRQLVGDAGVAVLLLLVVTILSIYKPWGPTRYGLRRQDANGQTITEAIRRPLPRGLALFLVLVGVVLVVFAFLHHGGGSHHAIH